MKDEGATTATKKKENLPGTPTILNTLQVQENTSRATIEGRISARNQFVALAAGALVERCGRNSPVRSVWSQSLLCEFGRSWVVCAVRQIGVILTLDPHCTKARERRLNVWMGVSPTGGIVGCGCHHYVREFPSRCSTTLLGSDGDMVGCIGGGIHARWDACTIRINDGEGIPVRVFSWPGKLVTTLSTCSSRWVVVVAADLGDANQFMTVWRVGMNGALLRDSHSIRIKPSLDSSFLWGSCSCLQGDTLVVSGRPSSCDSSEVVFIDLVKTIDENTLVVSKTQSFPGFSCHNLVLCNPIATEKIQQVQSGASKGTGFKIRRTLTCGRSSRVINDCADTFCISDDIVCTEVVFPVRVHNYFQLPNLSTPVLSVPSDQVIRTVPLEPRQGVVAVQSTPSSISIFDVVSASVLAVVSLT
ncbi:hypothetical protein Pelo_5956 [Pelomyxa schiedti]|nr:hypothetical protein Pelo_5956 [Pelomyxa schiedti]